MHVAKSSFSPFKSVVSENERPGLCDKISFPMVTSCDGPGGEHQRPRTGLRTQDSAPRSKDRTEDPGLIIVDRKQALDDQDLNCRYEVCIKINLILYQMNNH